ncbi:MAG: hypothetical protein FRX49_13246 [Trebouxia sp. A1-2]|nr:MAG: hypothetical protein FRX49_13246 [Trebouxia sp. A1-2]
MFNIAPRVSSTYRDCKIPLLLVTMFGDFAQGGLMFGWNALALALKGQDIYATGCAAEREVLRNAGGSDTLCPTQESKLAVLWTIGIFALNFGPVFVGPILDWVGPKLTSVLGTLLNMLGLILIACSKEGGFNGLPAGAVILGLGGITYHLAQFHISNLFPGKRGLISSLYVAGFTGCGIIFYILYEIYNDLGGSTAAYRGTIIIYAFIIFLWVPLNLWMMPWTALRIGEVYVMTTKWQFKAVQRMDLGSDSDHGISLSSQKSNAGTNGTAVTASGVPIHEDHREAFSNLGLMQQHVSSSDPHWNLSETPRKRAMRSTNSGISTDGLSDVALSEGGSPMAGAHANGHVTPAGLPLADVEVGNSRNSTQDVAWGPLVFEARRFVELRKKSLWQQFLSAESFGMGLFYTLNVFCIQFYLGTTRLQLEHKGDDRHHYTNFANVIVSFGFVVIPLIGWLLDHKGYGVTMGGHLDSVAVGRFMLYSSYFAIFGALFGFTNFGKMVAIDNTFNGLVGLLQLPFTYWALHGLGGNFTLINCLQIVVLLPLFLFCWFMYKWERQELVPIRPMEGEELPCNVSGPRMLREADFVTTLKKTIPLEAPDGNN